MTLSIRLFLSVQAKSGQLQQTLAHGISQYWAVDGYCSSPQGVYGFRSLIFFIVAKSFVC
jgi:hypothetical protein